jgi:hypothetical protein
MERHPEHVIELVVCRHIVRKNRTKLATAAYTGRGVNVHDSS